MSYTQGPGGYNPYIRGQVPQPGSAPQQYREPLNRDAANQFAMQQASNQVAQVFGQFQSQPFPQQPQVGFNAYQISPQQAGQFREQLNKGPHTHQYGSPGGFPNVPPPVYNHPLTFGGVDPQRVNALVWGTLPQQTQQQMPQIYDRPLSKDGELPKRVNY